MPEPAIKSLFAPDNQFANWTGTVHFSVYQNSVAINFTPDCTGVPPWYVQFTNSTAMKGLPTENLETVIPVGSRIC